MATDTDRLAPFSEEKLQADQAEMKERMRERMRHARSIRMQKVAEKKKMEASSTTLNIQGPEVEQNVGSSEQVPTVSKPEETVVVSASALANLQAQIAELQAVKQVAGGMSFEQLKFFIEEMKKPDPETAEKLAAEKEKRNQEKKNMLELALLEEQEKQNREANCGHRKESGRTAFVLGHRGDDGNYKYLCQHCQKIVDSKLPPERFGVVTEGRVAFGPGNPLGAYEAPVAS